METETMIKELAEQADKARKKLKKKKRYMRVVCKCPACGKWVWWSDLMKKTSYAEADKPL